jgi:fructose-1,6-bisphosphatase/inositol monophosphatase family enzyme
MLHVEFPNLTLKEKAPGTFNAMCEAVDELMGTAYRVRGVGIGSLGLAYVAKGAFEAYVTLNGTTQVTDVGAGILSVKEAGGAVAIETDTGIVEHGVRVIAANSQETRDQLKKICRLPNGKEWKDV